jgi:serine/threonine-protein kinase
MTQGQGQEADPLVGSVVAGKYRIVKQLGEGGMGCVYLAEQQLGSTARKVALKTLHKHLSHDPHIKARFDREAGTVAALEHPNTIQVFDFGAMADGTLYLVMEFVQGRSVADILEKDGAMPPARVENILRQVCGSLEEAHGHGIIHRDLKPDNVILCERAGQKDWVEVLDFGIAKRSSEHDPNEAKLTQQGMVLGTPPYMSPEQFTGQPIDLRSDIYALGVMSYEMLVGKYPFEANTAWEWASKHMTEPPRPIETQPLGPNVPDRMRAAITRALAKNKDERFGSVKEFFEAMSTGGAAAVQGAQTAPAAPEAVAVGRAKTELGEPMLAPPAYAPPPAAPPVASASVPRGPAHAPVQAPRGGNGLVIGLGALAVVLIGGGIAAFALRGKPKPVPASDLSALADAGSPVQVASGAPAEEVDAAIVAADPLGGPVTTAGRATGGVGGGAGGAGGGGAGGAKTGTTPSKIPTPVIKVDPPICAQARDARKQNRPMAARLEAQCRGAGGTP